MSLFIWRHSQFVPAPCKQASYNGYEGFGITAREGTPDSGLEVDDVLLKGLEIVVLDALAPPSQVGVQTAQP